jgi:hypothetical protein
MLKLGPRPLREVDEEVLDDGVVVSNSLHAARKVVILQPHIGV